MKIVLDMSVRNVPGKLTILAFTVISDVVIRVCAVNKIN